MVLGAVLALGNYMNGGHNKRGQADGFQIDALSKALEIKDNANKQTLVEYLIGLMKDLYPEILRYVPLFCRPPTWLSVRRAASPTSCRLRRPRAR